ncbi:zinc carboxypeptidase-like [Battus philenor]|uniref:zinc carboxypeptidase-like n=1 Tax=Battus philenor TaxID=42288 RepID=UPI0035CF693F
MKNRRPTGRSQIGVDLSKNWNSQWGVSGGSFDPSQNNYIGLGPFSEPETRYVSEYIRTIGSNLAGLLSMRAFGQRLLIPFAHSSEPIYNYQDMITIGRRAMGSLAVKYNTQYLVGTSKVVHDGSTGTIADWVKHRFNPPVVATYQLRDRLWGYTLPVNQILPSCEETFDSVMAIIREAIFIKKFKVIDKQKVATYTRNNPRNMTWDRYYKLDDINAWLNDMISAHSNVASAIIGGRSYEGHDIKGIKISHGSGRRAVFIEGGIHAREWISPATVCYIINELLTSRDAETRAAAVDFDWYIFPVTNPDGYIWSHENRMWRKNRRPFGAHFGVDLNRNWNNNWLVHGANSNPATDIFAGLGPFSEPETRSLSSYIRSISSEIDLYLSFHSFGHLLLIPFGNTTEPLANYHDAMNIGRRAMGALSVRYGTKYVAGNIAEAIYLATGGSVDWVKESLKVPLVYCYELRDNGVHGFLLPEDQILPNNQEVMDSLIDLIHQAKRFGYMSSAPRYTASMLTLLALLTYVF